MLKINNIKKALIWAFFILLFSTSAFSHTASTTIDGGLWQGTHWYHRFILIIPDNLKIKNYVLLHITGSESIDRPLPYLSSLSNALGMACGIIYDIPNQPLFGGLREDALLSYSFEQFIKTKDSHWIILNQMAKSVRAAMDYIEDYFSHHFNISLEGFILSGASKRGWTTYIVGAKDKRVRGIIPLSFDNVNFLKTLPHQLEQWGVYSSDLSDYTEKGIVDMMATPIGKKLLKQIDPWYMRKKLKIPKLIVTGTNDTYWTIDAASLYFSDLWGPKYIYYMPNRGHSLGWDRKIFSTIEKFILSVVYGYRLPSFKFSYDYTGKEDRVYFRVKGKKIRPKGVSIWFATSYTKDFRDAIFREKPLFFSSTEKAFFGWIWLPKSRFMAFYPEVEYNFQDKSYYLCAPARIVRGQLAHPEMVPSKK